MLKSFEHEKLWRNSTYESTNFKNCSEVRSADPPQFHFSKNREPW